MNVEASIFDMGWPLVGNWSFWISLVGHLLRPGRAPGIDAVPELTGPASLFPSPGFWQSLVLV